MAGTGFQVSYDGVLEALGALEKSVKDPGPALDAVANSIAEDSRQNFDEQSDPWGNSWKKLAPATKRARRGDGGDAQILQDDGHLLSSIEGHATSDGEAVVGAGSGPSAVYAAIHQFGGKAGRNHAATIPARPYLPVTKDGVDLPASQEKTLMDVIQQHLETADG